MGRIKVILNPTAGRGYGGRVEPTLRQLLTEEELDFDLVRTTGPWHAAELAECAARDGFELIVAAGGDGTTNEVVNGLVAASGESVAGTLGLIPVGSGSDFAANVGIPSDLRGACHRLAHGSARLVDICQITVPGENVRYFDNTVNVGFGGTVTVESRKMKYLRGLALYLPVVLKTIFLTQAPRVTIEYDGEKLALSAEMVCVANGAREGGGFFCTPDARLDDGLLDLCIVRETTKATMLGLVPRFMKGTHVNHRAVTMARAEHVIIASPDNLVAHADGEILCTEAHRIEFRIIPGRLRVWC